MPAIPTPWKTNNYPSARRSDHVDVYKSETKGEVRVHDPYQWLEGNTEETEQWTTAQEAYTREFLDKNPERQVLEDEIRRNTDYAKFSAPSFKEDGRWYWYYNSGLQAQSVMYRSKDSTLPKLSAEDGPGGEVFFDPNLLSSDGTAALSSTAFSRSGKYFAYGISRSGSDFFTIYVRPTDAPLATVNGTNVSHDTGRLSDEIRFVKFSSITWTHDSKGFFYQRFADRESHGSAAEDKAGTETESDKNAMLYYHRIGTSQSEDVLVLKDPSNPEWMWGAEISEVDGRYLLVTISRDTSRKNQLWVADLQQEVIGPNIKWDKLIDKFEAKYEYVANDGAKFYLYSNADAPQHKLVSIDLADPSEKRSFVEVIPEDKNAHLEDVRAINKDNFAVVYKRNVKDEVYIYTTAGEKVTRLAEDFVGAATLSGRRHQSWFFVTLVGFTTPGTIARYDFGESEAKRWSIFNQTLVSGLNPDDFLAEQVWYESKDGTKVPMFIVRHKKTKFDGTAPGIQYGYGGFTISINPFFSSSILTFLQRYGAVLAVPNIRGGGEFGEEWHLGGARENKANCFDDFIAATEFLVKNKYVAPGKVAINGGSNGGLLVAACVNRAPEGLLGAAVAEVGVLDLLKFADFTIGRAWTSDYGNPHDPHDFDFIYPISPLHNVPTDKVLPPTILLTADHDDRVVPLHSFKHAATLQHLLPSNPHPLLIRIDKKAGHGAGKSTEQRIKEQADKWGFVVQTLGLVSHVSGWQEIAESTSAFRCELEPRQEALLNRNTVLVLPKRMIAGRFAARIPYIHRCWSPSPKIRRILLFTRFYSDPARRLRNEEIKYPMVRFVDPETGALQPMASYPPLLASITQKTHFLELVSEEPEPIVRLISRKLRHEREKGIKQKKKENKMEQKEVQLTWGVAAGDLGHKLKKVRQELMKGNRVSLVFAPRKGQPPLKPEQMAAKVQETADALADIGKEWKAREMQKSTAAIHFQGIVVPSKPTKSQ